MPFRRPLTPYSLTTSSGGVYTALAAVGAVANDHLEVQRWNPFAGNDTRNRNIILVGQDTDAELGFLANYEHFNPYSYATTAVTLDCQLLYDMLYPGEQARSLVFLISFCFPAVDVASLHLHNGGNDAYWELKVCLRLMKMLADTFAPESGEKAACEKVWDAIFVCVDVEALNGRHDHITELGFASLDSRKIQNIHDPSYENHITAAHVILKGAVPIKKSNGKRYWQGQRFGKGANFETDEFDARLGMSMEIWPSEIGRNINHFFFVPAGNKTWNWIAPGGLKPHDGGDCLIQKTSPYWSSLLKRRPDQPRQNQPRQQLGHQSQRRPQKRS